MLSIEFTGNVTRDAELRSTQNGVSVCSFTVAVNDRFDKAKEPTYFKVSAWRKLGETCGKNIKQGMKVWVRCDALKTTPYTPKNGSDVRVSLEVNAVDVEIENWGNKDNSSSNNAQVYEPQQSVAQEHVESQGFTAVETDELPF